MHLKVLSLIPVVAGSVFGQPGWQVVPSPNAGPIAQGNTLLAVAALTANDAWAVGFTPSPIYCTTCPAPLVMHWDGLQWSLVETPAILQPKVELEAVAAVSSNDVWAVGHWLNDTTLTAGTLIKHWNGTSWSVVPSPNPGIFNSLYGVSAASATDIWAVGEQWPNWSTHNPLILHYDGASWTVVASPPINQGRLNAVHALAPDDAWAVGPGLVLHWDGASWTQRSLPPEEGYVELTSVSGVAPDDVWVVGHFRYSSHSGHPLSASRAFHWDGTGWTRVLYAGLGGQDSRTYDVHAIASNDVWAVGGQPGEPGSGVAFEYVTAHWDGAAWSTVDTPNQGVLYSISASSGSDVWAVGYGFDNLGFGTGTHTLHYTSGGPCYPDCNTDGALNLADFGCFQTAFATGNMYADCNGDLVLNLADFGCFQTKFALGCP